MKRTKGISLLLSLLLLVSLVIPSVLPVSAVDEGGTTDGMVVNKTAVSNGDGTYKITLEAYATGAKVITKQAVPADIVLVLDQSGSMANSMHRYVFEAYDRNTTNEDFYSYRHNGGSKNLYYQLEDGSYAAVSVTYEDLGFAYTEITEGRNNDTGDWYNPYTSYWENRNNLYALVNDIYQKVTVTRSGRFSYTYTLPDGTVIATSERNTGEPSFTGIDEDCLYLRSVDETQRLYTYSYTDASGTDHTFTSTGVDGEPEQTLYERRQETTGSRLAALKTAVNTFADSVHASAKGADGVAGTSDDVQHRVAVVGFANGPGDYSNTELFIGGDSYTYEAWGWPASDHYYEAFQDMSTEDGYNNVIRSKDELTANGSTYAQYGLHMANDIFAENPLDDGEKRNRVVILFTDGAPGYNTYDSNVANAAIDVANTLRATYGATVYSVGIFDGADASSAGVEHGNTTEKSNWFMQNVSNNRGVPQNPSYYLSAADADSLNKIFEDIADNIEGGTSVTLDENSVVEDVISPYFTLPKGATAADITLETYSYTAENTWEKNADAMGAEATIDGNTVRVTGFDFAEHYVGTETTNGNKVYRGDKLVISFSVEPKPGFLGGNGVPTNTSAGIYQNADAEEPTVTFPVPDVDVPIEPVGISGVQDFHVYLDGDVTEDDFWKNVSITSNGTDILHRELLTWQDDYVNINVTVNGAVTGQQPPYLDNWHDKDLTIYAAVTPNNQAGTAEFQKAENAVKIYVYKPTVTFKDGTVDYKSEISDTAYISDGQSRKYDTDNRVSGVVWKHGEIVADPPKMTGTEPSLTYTYQVLGQLDGGRVPDVDYVAVDVAVLIGDKSATSETTFVHRCDVMSAECPYNATNLMMGKFLLHVINKSGNLTITKNVELDSTDVNQSFLFRVTGPDGFAMDVVITGPGSVTIQDLPVGEYTVTEQTGWSWRYTPEDAEQKVTIDGGDKTVVFTNTRVADYTSGSNGWKWLNGCAVAVNNWAARSN